MSTRNQDGISNQQQTIDLALALSTVILFYLAFPSGGYAELTWLVIVPILIAIHGKPAKYAFKLVMLTATLGWIVSIWWVIPALADITLSPANIFIPFVFLFCVFAALPYGISAWLHCRYQMYNSIGGVLTSALILTILNNALPHLLPGNLAHALYLETELIQLASIGGVAIVFFIIHSTSFLIAYAFSHYRIEKRKSISAALFALAIIMSNTLFGNYSINAITESVNKNSPGDLTVTLVQPNISIQHRTRADWQKISGDIKQLLTKANTANTDLIIMPEVPVPISSTHYQFDKKLFNQAANETPLMLAAISPLNGDKNLTSYFNTTELIANNDTQVYKKQMLLPFGEYLPYEQEFPILRELFPNAPNYQPGTEQKPLGITHR